MNAVSGVSQSNKNPNNWFEEYPTSKETALRGKSAEHWIQSEGKEG